MHACARQTKFEALTCFGSRAGGVTDCTVDTPGEESAPGARPPLRRRSAGCRATPDDHDSCMPAADKPGLKVSLALARPQEGSQNAWCTRRARLHLERALGYTSGTLATALALTHPSPARVAAPAMSARSCATAWLNIGGLRAIRPCWCIRALRASSHASRRPHAAPAGCAGSCVLADRSLEDGNAGGPFNGRRRRRGGPRGADDGAETGRAVTVVATTFP